MQNGPRKAAHCVYNITYHLAWCTKYRKSVLIGQEAIDLREAIRQVCIELDAIILQGNIRADHVKLYVSIPPSISISKFIGILKSKTARHMFLVSNTLQHIYPKRHLWATGYFVTTDMKTAHLSIERYLEVDEESLSNAL